MQQESDHAREDQPRTEHDVCGATTASPSPWSKPRGPAATLAWASSRPKLYADRLEASFGQRPLIYYTNGYEHWFWDDTHYPPRPVAGLPQERRAATARAASQQPPPLADARINPAIVERRYQQRAIRRIAETFEQDRQRRASVVMTTGAGKTRTVVALTDLLMRCNWAKRVLFLADRVALVDQAVNASSGTCPTPRRSTSSPTGTPTAAYTCPPTRR